MSLKVHGHYLLLAAAIGTAKAPIAGWTQEAAQVLERQSESRDDPAAPSLPLPRARDDEPDPDHSTASAQAARSAQGAQGASVAPTGSRNQARMGAPSVWVDPPQRRLMHAALIEQSLRAPSEPDEPEQEYPTGSAQRAVGAVGASGAIGSMSANLTGGARMSFGAAGTVDPVGPQPLHAMTSANPTTSNHGSCEVSGCWSRPANSCTPPMDMPVAAMAPRKPAEPDEPETEHDTRSASNARDLGATVAAASTWVPDAGQPPRRGPVPPSRHVEGWNPLADLVSSNGPDEPESEYPTESASLVRPVASIASGIQLGHGVTIGGTPVVAPNVPQQPQILAGVANPGPQGLTGPEGPHAFAPQDATDGTLPIHWPPRTLLNPLKKT
jgi:hypothetical protein